MLLQYIFSCKRFSLFYWLLNKKKPFHSSGSSSKIVWFYVFLALSSVIIFIIFHYIHYITQVSSCFTSHEYKRGQMKDNDKNYFRFCSNLLKKWLSDSVTGNFLLNMSSSTQAVSHAPTSWFCKWQPQSPIRWTQGIACPLRCHCCWAPWFLQLFWSRYSK